MKIKLMSIAASGLLVASTALAAAQTPSKPGAADSDAPKSLYQKEKRPLSGNDATQGTGLGSDSSSAPSSATTGSSSATSDGGGSPSSPSGTSGSSGGTGQ